MFNPLVDSFDDLTDSEVDDKIQELSRKYWQTKNPSLQQQISTVLEMFKAEAATRRAKQLQKSQTDSESGLDNLINVS
jgi:hypothetical protein